MDWVVHINNGSMEAKPIVLRLLPGEETIFNLKVVNHGEPSNISLEASNPVFKAVRLRKPDHYVVAEETIPIMARMPSNKRRLEGEILLSSSSGENRVPITLLRDSEDPGDDLEDPKLQVDEDLPQDRFGNRVNRTGQDYGDDEDEDPDDAEPAENLDREDGDEGDPDDNLEDNSEDRLEDGLEDNSDDDGDDYDRIAPRRKPDYDEDEREPRRIVFSKDKDLQRYRSATRSKNQSQGKNLEDDANDNASDNVNDDVNDDAGDLRPYVEREDPAEAPEDSFMEGQRRFRERLAGRVDREQGFIDEGRSEEIPDSPVKSYPASSSQDGDQYFRQNQVRQNQEIGSGGYGSESGYTSQYPSSNESPSENYDADGDYQENEGAGGLFGNFGDFGALQIIPIVIFLALVVVLVLTFITESIPEFPGALGSSILIVTLIIYGAATLLKA